MERRRKIVTVSGPPGSGTTTVCRLLSEATGWPHLNAGQIFRDLAGESGLSLAEFGRLAEQDASIDRRLDARMVARARKLGQVILEGRMTGWMAHRNGLPALKVWLQADLQVRAARVGKRDRRPVEQALEEMRARERSEAKRYREIHGIDIGDLSIYDLCIDTDQCTPGQVADRILARLEEE